MKVLGNLTLVEKMKSKMRSTSISNSMGGNTSYKFGRTHEDQFSCIQPVESGLDILCRVAEVEDALAGKILCYCSTATLYSMRMVSKQWAELVMTWFTTRDKQVMNNWFEGVPSREVFECQDYPSKIAVDDFSVVVGMENGE